MINAALTVLGISVGALALLCAFIYFRQERMIFYPQGNDPELRAQWRWRRVEIPSGRHVLEAWWAEAGAPESDLTIVYFGGNAEDVLFTARSATAIAAKRMLVTNYRGYGTSTGSPSERALMEDALAIYDYVRGPGGTDPRHIVLMGRSLGSAVATSLAANREVRGVVLITPFDSMAAIAARYYPRMLVDRLLRHRFASVEVAPRAQAPALMLIAERDQIVPASHSLALAGAWAGPKQLKTFEGVGHNDIQLHPDYYATINRFLSTLAEPAP